MSLQTQSEIQSDDFNPNDVAFGDGIYGLPFARTWPNHQEITIKARHYLQEDVPHEIGLAMGNACLENVVDVLIVTVTHSKEII